jgi:hypothetical protein
MFLTFCLISNADFPPTSASLYIEADSPPPSAIAIQWKRMQSFVVDAPLLFSGPPGPNDIQQVWY